VVDEETVLAFVRSSIKSGWSLELLLLLHREPQKCWSVDALIRELRGSQHLVDKSVATLRAAGLLAVAEAGVSYQPQSPERAELTAALADLYANKPITVMNAIFASPNDKIRSLSDAFLFQKK
jgi:hypothetical protein